MTADSITKLIRRILPYDDLAAQEQEFLDCTIAPELVKYSSTQRSLILKRLRAVVDNRQRHPSPFPTGKEYARGIINVDGLLRHDDPLLLTTHLLHGLISKDERKLATAATSFDAGVLRDIRSSVNERRLFANTKTFIAEPNEGTALSALSRLRDDGLANHARLGRIVQHLQTAIERPQDARWDALVTRSHPRLLNLSRDFGQYGCCAFWGTGERDLEYQMDLHSRYHSSVLYLADPEIGLLFNHIERGDGDQGLPCGAIILASMLGRDTQRPKEPETRYLLVDSIEAFRPSYDARFPHHPLRNVPKDLWRKQDLAAILEAAKDIGAERIIYYAGFWNEGGRQFTSYFQERTGAVDRTVTLRKEGGRRFIPHDYDERFGFFLDSLLTEDCYHNCHATRGNADGVGTVQGLVARL